VCEVSGYLDKPCLIAVLAKYKKTIISSQCCPIHSKSSINSFITYRNPFISTLFIRPQYVYP
jgi:hypothetical protein